jgi:hypothetical protein
MDEIVNYGNIEIVLPNETLGCFLIFQDLVNVFGVTYQYEAVGLLKSELKNCVDLKPKPNIDYEADNTYIESRSADTIFKVVETINNLTIEKLKAYLSNDEKREILKKLKTWKRPKAAKWKVGDVFSLKLKDETFMFGQIIDTHLTHKSPTCCLFEIKKKTDQVTYKELIESRIISIENTDNEYLSNKTFKILFNVAPLANAKVSKKRIIGDSTLLNLCNAYYGLEPWNVLYDATYYDKMLFGGIKRPKTVLLLDEKERNKYRLEHFGINENNERIGK